MGTEPEHLDLDVGGGLHVGATVYRPDRPPRRLLWCVPGGGQTRAFWDFPVDGHPPESFSFARHAVAAGHLVVTADHLGSGGSSHPEDEALLTADELVAAMSRAVSVARRRLGFVDLPSVGVGHSMGSGFTLYQHDRHHDHTALALFGWSNIALLVPGRDGVRRAVGTPGSGGNMRLHNFAPDTPEELVAASRAIGTVMPEPALRWLIAEPNRLAAAAERVEVPVFLGHGAQDVTPDPEGDAALYRRAPSVTSHVLASAHHFLHDRPNRHELWDAFLAWTDRLDRDGAPAPTASG